MGYGTLVKKQFTVPKLSFYFIFWAIHFFLFGFGWYGFPPLISALHWMLTES